MKNKKLIYLLAFTAIISIVAVILKFSFKYLFTDLVCFPFEQISTGLRWLSLEGGLQNIAAIIIYLAFCLAPILLFLSSFNKKPITAEDGLLAVLTILLFYVMYMLINPGLMPTLGGFGLNEEMVKVLLCGTIYSVIITYFILIAVRIFFYSETKNLNKYMVLLLSLTAILYTISIFGVELNNFFAQIEAVNAGNEGTEIGLGFTFIFLFINYVVSNVGSIVSIYVILVGINFAKELKEDPYSDETIVASEHLSKVCKLGLIITVCSSTAFNVLQLIFISELRNINALVQIPIFSVVFVLGMLILSRLVIENKIIKDENDSII